MGQESSCPGATKETRGCPRRLVQPRRKRVREKKAPTRRQRIGTLDVGSCGSGAWVLFLLFLVLRCQFRSSPGVRSTYSSAVPVQKVTYETRPDPVLRIVKHLFEFHSD